MAFFGRKDEDPYARRDYSKDNYNRQYDDNPYARTVQGFDEDSIYENHIEDFEEDRAASKEDRGTDSQNDSYTAHIRRSNSVLNNANDPYARHYDPQSDNIYKKHFSENGDDSCQSTKYEENYFNTAKGSALRENGDLSSNGDNSTLDENCNAGRNAFNEYTDISSNTAGSSFEEYADASSNTADSSFEEYADSSSNTAGSSAKNTNLPKKINTQSQKNTQVGTQGFDDSQYPEDDSQTPKASELYDKATASPGQLAKTIGLAKFIKYFVIAYFLCHSIKSLKYVLYSVSNINFINGVFIVAALIVFAVGISSIKKSKGFDISVNAKCLGKKSTAANNGKSVNVPVYAYEYNMRKYAIYDKTGADNRAARDNATVPLCIQSSDPQMYIYPGGKAAELIFGVANICLALYLLSFVNLIGLM